MDTHETLEKQLDDVRRLAHETAIRADERWASHLRALGIQTLELERRLDHLNGEAARFLASREETASQLRREIEQGDKTLMRELVLLREMFATHISRQEGANKGLQLAWGVFLAILMATISIISIWVTK